MRKMVPALLLFTNLSYGADIYVMQKDKSFHLTDEASPAIVEVKAKLGDTLYFINKEKDVTHNVFSLTPGNEFEIKVQTPNNKKEDGMLKLEKGKNKAGVMEIECAIHPNMTLKVNISE